MNKSNAKLYNVDINCCYLNFNYEKIFYFFCRFEMSKTQVKLHDMWSKNKTEVSIRTWFIIIFSRSSAEDDDGLCSGSAVNDDDERCSSSTKNKDESRYGSTENDDEPCAGVRIETSVLFLLHISCNFTCVLLISNLKEK